MTGANEIDSRYEQLVRALGHAGQLEPAVELC
jgi:hypothetical protein